MRKVHDQNDAESVHDRVREGYARIANEGYPAVTTPQAATPQPAGAGCGCGPASGCGPTGVSADELAQQMGYATDELADLPDGANMGLSCGNPTALASLRPGEVVLDLGSGGGFDCFLAGPRVGAAGRVIGVDMTPEMLSKARRNVMSYRQRTGLDNVEFPLFLPWKNQRGPARRN